MSYLNFEKNKSKDLLNDIKEFNKKLNTFDYGFIYKGKKSTEFQYYKTISPEIFEKYKIGVCWDYVEYEARYFSKLGFKNTTKPLNEKEFSLYYICYKTVDNVNPTHTWLVFKLNDSIYAFESSWGNHQGVHKFKSEKEMLNTYDRWEIALFKPNYTKGKVVFKYKPMRKFEKSCQRYMTDIHTNGICYFSDFPDRHKPDYSL